MSFETFFFAHFSEFYWCEPWCEPQYDLLAIVSQTRKTYLASCVTPLNVNLMRVRIASNKFAKTRNAWLYILLFVLWYLPV